MIRYSNKVNNLIHLSFSVNGDVKEPDIVGTLLSSSAALLAEYGIVKLQNENKIGKLKAHVREEDKLLDQNGNVLKTRGMVEIGTNLDHLDNAILTAVLEQTKKVHLFDAAFYYHHHEKVEQQNSVVIYKRALELSSLFTEASESNRTSEIRKALTQSLCSKKSISYKDFTMGSKFNESETVFLVEGRKDVQVLAKCNYFNTLALGGFHFDEVQAVNLLKNKKTVAFFDGDDGGQQIFKKLLKVHEPHYVIQTPKKVSVEDLSKREVIELIKNKRQYLS